VTGRHAIAGLVLVAMAGSVPARGQNLMFRLSTDLVPVYVSIRDGGSIVSGLRPEDFTLTDRGVRQTVEVASSDAVPIDVSLVVDTSRSVINSLARFRADVTAIVNQLRPDEQIRLITFDTDVRQILNMQPPSVNPPTNEIRLGETTSLVDAMVMALARPRRPERRHLVFVFTDGYDTSSVLAYGALPDLVTRTDSLVHIALVKPSGVDLPSAAAVAALSTAASRTGGALYPPALGDTGIVAAFQRAIDNFRHSYVLYFTPTDVPGAGWHNIGVQVLKPGTFDIRAREGYFAR
jgi:VWFA-related protein